MSGTSKNGGGKRYPEIMSVKAMAARLKEEGTGITPGMLRRAVAAGKIPLVDEPNVRTKRVRYTDVINYFLGEGWTPPEQSEPPAVGGIRRIC